MFIQHMPQPVCSLISTLPTQVQVFAYGNLEFEKCFSIHSLIGSPQHHHYSPEKKDVQRTNDVPNIILLEMWSTETRAMSSHSDATVFYWSVGK